MVIYTLLRVEEKNIILDRYFPLKREFFMLDFINGFALFRDLVSLTSNSFIAFNQISY